MAARIITVSALSTPNSSSYSSHTSPIKSSSLSLPRNFTPLRPEGSMKSLLGEKLSVSSSNLSSPVHPKRQCSTVLPTANPEKLSKENMPKWSMKAVKAFAMGQVEARRLRYLDTRTETLLMGILLEGTSLASWFLCANGITYSKMKKEFIIKFEDRTTQSPLHPPVSESAQRALDWAIDEKLKSGESGEVTPSHMLLSVWSEKESGGHRIRLLLVSMMRRLKQSRNLQIKTVEWDVTDCFSCSDRIFFGLRLNFCTGNLCRRLPKICECFFPQINDIQEFFLHIWVCYRLSSGAFVTQLVMSRGHSVHCY